MNGIYRCAMWMGSISLLLIFTGCKSLVTMPINEESHLSVSSEPFGGQYLMVSYHRNAPGPKSKFNMKWDTEIQLNGFGTVYASDREGSPAFNRIESAWQILREEDRYGLDTLYDLSPKPAVTVNETSKRSEPKEETVARPEPTLQLPLSMFSVRPHW